jgi:fumarylacetoacetase
MGDGAISGATDSELSSMLEFTFAGKRPIMLPNGERRGFLVDGDEIRFEGRCTREGYGSINCRACVGRIEASHQTNGPQPRALLLMCREDFGICSRGPLL